MRQVVKIIAIIILVTSPLLIAFIIVSPAIPFPIKLTGKLQITVSCPVPEQFCRKGQTLEMSLPEDKKKYDGLGWMLPEKTNILAAFDGSYKEQDVHGLPSLLRVITLTGNNNKYEARYFFVPEKKLTVAEQQKNMSGKSIKKGEKLATVSATPLTNIGYKEVNLQFYLVDKGSNGKTIKLKIGDLGKIKLE